MIKILCPLIQKTLKVEPEERTSTDLDFLDGPAGLKANQIQPLLGLRDSFPSQEPEDFFPLKSSQVNREGVSQ